MLTLNGKKVILLLAACVLACGIYIVVNPNESFDKSPALKANPSVTNTTSNNSVEVEELAKVVKETNSPPTNKTSNVKKTNLPWPVNCVDVSDDEKQHLNEMFEKVANEQVFTPYDVNEHLKTMDEVELIAEFEAGDKAAAYVLGLHYSFSFYNTSRRNPLVNFDSLANNKTLESIDTKALAKARKWLWTAATHGVPIALYELGLTYRVESSYLQRSIAKNEAQQLSNKVLNKLLLLKANELAYKKLSEDVAPDMVYFFGTPHENLSEKFEKLKYKKKTKIYQDIYDKWSADREETGRPFLVDFNFPEHIKRQLVDMHKLCNYQKE